MMVLATLLLLLASLAVQSLALPLGPYMFGDGPAGRDGGVEYFPLQRSKRNDPPEAIVSDYATTVFEHRPSWRNSNCQSTFNCNPVSPQHCGYASANFFSSDGSRESQTGYGCELNFTILVEDGGVTEAAELALFKKSEPNADQNLLYYVFIVYKPQNATNYATVVEDRYIFPSCNSWQVFNLSSIKSYFPPGVHKINLLIAVFKDSLNPTQQLPEHMSCEETKSLFVMDSNVNINEFLDQPAPQDQSESKTESPQVEQNLSQDDGNKNDAANNQTPEEIVNLEEGEGSGGEELHETNPAAKYRPELSVFVSGTSTPFLTAKRSVGELTRDDQIYAEVGDGKDEIDQASGSDCKRLDKKIFLSEFYPGVLQPQIVNVGQCFNSSDSIQCLPSKYMNLEILRKIGEHQLTIQTLQNFIITECTPYANAHDQPIPPV